MPQINGYPSHPSGEDMISAADIKDQELPRTSIKPVYWNGTHPSVFEFRVEKERNHDFDAAGASVWVERRTGYATHRHIWRHLLSDCEHRKRSRRATQK